MNLLFVCNQGKNRSKTAEEIFSGRFNTKSAGLYSENPLTEQELSWADLVLVMEEDQRKQISIRFPRQYLMKRIVSLDIPDQYRHDDPKLIDILKKRTDGLF